MTCWHVVHSDTMTTRKNEEDKELRASIVDYFSAVVDPRVERTRHHPLDSMLVLALCAILCGADSFAGIEAYGRAKQDWLKSFLNLPHGIPSHDTFGRVFAALNPDSLAEAFRTWVAAIADLSHGEVIAIDGKTLRRSFQTADSRAFVHMVSAWATSNRIVLGQVKTEEKSNEITAIPRLLKLLQIKNCLVTIDAMGCQKDIAADIIATGADYMLAVKDNQPRLAADLELAFEQARKDPESFSLDFHETTDKKRHGRTEVRRCWTTSMVDCLSQGDQWQSLSSLAMIEAERTVDGKTSTENRYYISSRRNFSAADALQASRSHWGIENELHWVLDVAFREDDCRVRVGNAAENFAVLRHCAINLLKAVKSTKLGVKNKRLCAAWDQTFFLQVLMGTA